MPPNPSTNAVLGWESYDWLCSLTKRGNGDVENVYDLFFMNSIQEEYFQLVHNKDPKTITVTGDPVWHKNRKNEVTSNNCGRAKINASDQVGSSTTQTNHGQWTSTEIAGWSQFFSDVSAQLIAHFPVTSKAKIADNANLNPLDVRYGQAEITWQCGYALKTDGRVGKRTLNAADYCVLPCE